MCGLTYRITNNMEKTKNDESEINMEKIKDDESEICISVSRKWKFRFVNF